MKTEQRKSRLALTLLFGGIVFVNLLLVAVVLAVIGFILIKTGVLTEFTPEPFHNPGVVLVLVIISIVIGAAISMFVSRI